MAQRQAQWWLPIALFLLLAAIVGGIFLASNIRGGQPVEIVLPTPTTPTARQVLISGAVHASGIYTAQDNDTLEDLLRAAGGITSKAAPDQIRLIVPQANEIPSPQKININTAEVWLLEALPNIGEKLAEAIVNYRKNNGPFHFSKDITKVPGITNRVYERIQGLITVGE